jgi:hypothetical protein
MAEFEPKHAGKPIYLQNVELGEICFLQEALYWVAFGRLPIEINNRGDLIEGYKTNVPNDNGELTEEECDRAGLPHDPRLKYDWANDVMLTDKIEEIVASRELVEAEPGEDESVRKEEIRREAQNLLEEMTQWRPKFERAIALAASEVYAAFGRGRLTSKGIRLPDPDIAVSLKLLGEENKKIGELDDVAIPKDFWSLPNIYWEISAARNDTEHYCQIHCSTDELISVFPIEAVTTGESVDGLIRHGSFYVLSPNSGAAATPVRRSQARGRAAGRHRKYRWDDLHVDMAALVRAGLPHKKEAAVEQVRDLYRRKYGEPVPANRTLHEFLKPYYERYSGNPER